MRPNKFTYLLYIATLLSNLTLYADQNDRFDLFKEHVVLDKKTNLLWVNTTNKPVVYDLKEAQEYCNTLKLDGLSGWVVPTYSQLLTLVNYNASVPALYPIFDTRTTKDEKISEYTYWTQDPFPDNAYVVARNWGVDFSDGSSEETLNHHAVRCVKPGEGGEKPLFNFHRDNTKQVVIDQINKLMWLDDLKVYGNKTGGYTFKESQQFCQEITAAGFDDWRLPKIDELITLLDVSCMQMPYVNKNFKGVIKKSRYITETAIADKQFKGQYWYVGFGSGRISFTDYNSYHYCVRDIEEDVNETKPQLSK